MKEIVKKNKYEMYLKHLNYLITILQKKKSLSI